MAQQLEEEHAKEERPGANNAAERTCPDNGIEADVTPGPETDRHEKDNNMSNAVVAEAACLRAAHAAANTRFSMAVMYKRHPRATAKRWHCSSDRQAQIRRDRPGGTRRECVRVQNEVERLSWYQWCRILSAAVRLMLLTAGCPLVNTIIPTHQDIPPVTLMLMTGWMSWCESCSIIWRFLSG